MFPSWNSRKKRDARSSTIIEPYRALFGHSLPPDKQYWTLAGLCTRQDGRRLDHCELLQVVGEGLILERQFHSVEKELKIHTLNSVAYPETNWYLGDLYDTLARESASGNFNPGIVNVDLTCTPDGPYGVKYTSKILALLSDVVVSGELLVILNMLLKVYSYDLKDGDYVIRLFDECPQFQYAMEKRDWQFLPQYYTYRGSAGHDRTVMGSFHFTLDSRSR